MNTSYILIGVVMGTKNTKQKKNTENTKMIKKIKFSKTTKIIIAAVALVLCIATVLSIVLISNSMSPLEKFMLKIAKKQNCQMDVVLSGIPMFSPIAFSIEIDGNVTHIPDLLIVEECYVEKVGNETFSYKKAENGKWVKEKETDDDSALNLFAEKDLEKLINPDNYELVEGTENVYCQKADVQFENFKNVTITLEDDSCKIDMVAYVEISIFGKMALETQIVISKIGQVDITLPKVG